MRLRLARRFFSGDATAAEGSSAMLALVTSCGECQHPIRKTFSRLAYDKGVVLVKCDGCGVRHLVADNLGWMSDHSTTDGGKQKIDLSTLYGDRLKRGVLEPGALGEDGALLLKNSDLFEGLGEDELRALYVKATTRKH